MVPGFSFFPGSHTLLSEPFAVSHYAVLLIAVREPFDGFLFAGRIHHRIMSRVLVVGERVISPLQRGMGGYLVMTRRAMGLLVGKVRSAKEKVFPSEERGHPEWSYGCRRR